MKIVTVILKSGKVMDLSAAKSSELLAREEITMRYKGFNYEGDVKWEPTPVKEVANFLRVINGDKAWEIRESEIAAFEYLYDPSDEEVDEEIVI